MSEEQQVQSDDKAIQPNSEQSQPNEEIIANRSAEELAKRLKEVSQEAKLNRQKASELKRQNEELQKQKLQEQGQYKELAEISQRKAQEIEQQANKLKQAFAFKTVSDAVAMEAIKLGAKNVDDVIQLMQLDQIPIDDQFNVDRESVKTIMEDFKKKKEYLFNGKPGPKIADATPAKTEAPKFDLSKLTLAEKAALLSTLHNQGK